MTVRVWWGERPEWPYEEKALQQLVEKLANERESFFVFANVQVGTTEEHRPAAAQIDVLVMSGHTIAIAELKETRGLPVDGKSNGTWKRSDDVELGKVPAQVVHQYHVLRQALWERRNEFLSPNRAASASRPKALDDIKKFIVFCPSKNPDSTLDLSGHTQLLPPYGDVVGLDDLVSRLTNKRWRGNLPWPLREQEATKLAEALGLEEVTGTFETDSVIARRRNIRQREGGLVKGHRLRWLWAAVAGLGLVTLGVVLWLLLRVPLIGAEEAWNFIRGREVRVTFTIGGFSEHPNSVVLFAQETSDFTVEVVGISTQDQVGYLKGATVVVGPAKVQGAETTGRPQITLPKEDLRKKLLPYP